MKKLLSVILAAVVLLGVLSTLSACKKKDDEFKVGFILSQDEASTHIKSIMDSARQTAKKLGLNDSQIIFKTNVPESVVCYNEAEDLVKQGCDIIFADRLGHEEWMLKAAKEFPKVQFCQAGGVKAHTENLPNFHNAYASVYEGRFISGIAAGMKLNEMISEGLITAEEAIMGYVGAYPSAEVISGYSAFYLGARSVCPTVTMLVDFTDEWYSPITERNTAESLINKGCVVISQHTDSTEIPTLCENENIYNVPYNTDTTDYAPNTCLIATKINWAPYFEYMIKSVQEKTDMPTDYCGSLKNDSVQVMAVNSLSAAEGTKEAIDYAIADIKSGRLNVFDTATFTVGGGIVTTYLADVDDNGDKVGETEVIYKGIFLESNYRSAPYFDLPIDGIICLNTH